MAATMALTVAAMMAVNYHALKDIVVVDTRRKIGDESVQCLLLNIVIV